MGKKDKDLDLGAEIQSIQDEARGAFSLRDRLVGKNNRRKTVTIYTDATAGDRLGYAIDEELGNGIRTGRRIRKGLTGELDAIQEEGKALADQIDLLAESDQDIPDADTERMGEISAEIKRLKVEIAKVTKALNDSAMVFELQTLPDAIVKDVRRKTRHSLGIKAKGIPDARQEEYNDEYTVQMLSASVESWLDRETGDSYSTLTVEQAKELQGYLPTGQFPRLDKAMVELSFEAAIGNVGTDSADF